MKIIISDDDATTRAVLERALESWDYQVTTTKNGVEALDALLKQEESCLAILDWMMPELDGIEVCRIIREQKTAKGYIYIVILTGKQRKEDMIEGLQAGADDFLIKPFDHQELRMRLRVGQRILTLQEQLAERAYYDPLTRIYNRMAIFEILDREIIRATRSKQPLSVIMADLDHFKLINDTYGHLCGDHVLQEAAKRMKDSIRGYDSIGRYGGEEFLIVVPGVLQEETAHLANRICFNISKEPLVFEEHSINITLSMGIVDNQGIETVNVDTLIQQADLALYEAKNEGRNRIVIASEKVNKV